MTSLTLLQQTFQDYLLGKNKQAEQQIIGEPQTFIKQRLKIYSEAYQLRLIEILETDFPGLLLWLGEKKFIKISLGYIANYPSQFYAARDFGQYFARYLSLSPKLDKTGFLSQFAAFERALSEAVDMEEVPILDVAAIAAIDASQWPDMQLKLAPTVKYFKLDWNIPQIRQGLLVKKTKPRKVRYSKSKYWLIWWRNLDICFREISLQEHYIFASLNQQTTFNQLCDGLTSWYSEEQAAQTMVAFLHTWLPEKIFSRVII